MNIYVTIQWPCTYILPKPYSLKIFEYYIIALVLYTYIAHTALTRMPHDDIPRIRIFTCRGSISSHAKEDFASEIYVLFEHAAHVSGAR